jgi:hypothetical protein
MSNVVLNVAVVELKEFKLYFATSSTDTRMATIGVGATAVELIVTGLESMAPRAGRLTATFRPMTFTVADVLAVAPLLSVTVAVTVNVPPAL